MNTCKGCKHWSDPDSPPWAGSIQGPSERRALEMANERRCLRMGGFSGAGGFGGAYPRFVDGDHMPRNEAYLLSYAGDARLVTTPDFGCVLWETK